MATEVCRKKRNANCSTPANRDNGQTEKRTMDYLIKYFQHEVNDSDKKDESNKESKE